MEQYEKQYAASAAAHSDQSSKKSDHLRKTAASAKDKSAEQEHQRAQDPELERKYSEVCSVGVAENLAISSKIVPRRLKPQAVPKLPIPELWKPLPTLRQMI